MFESLGTTGKFVGLTAAFGIVASLWSKVQLVGSKIYGIFFVRARLQGELIDAFYVYCAKNHRKHPFAVRKFRTLRYFIRKLKRYSHIIREELSEESILYWHGKIPIFISFLNEADEKSSKRGVYLTCVRGTIDIEKFIFDVLSEYDRRVHYEDIKKNKNSRFYVRHCIGTLGIKQNSDSAVEDVEEDKSVAASLVEIGGYKIIGYEPDEIGEETHSDNPYINCLAFPDEVNDLVEEIKRWKESKDWYEKHMVPWKRGWSIFGIPGTGKTSLVRAIGEYVDLPIYAYDLSTMSNNDLIRKWNNMLSCTPCIALFEDVDTVFTGRENIVKSEYERPLSFDCFLNILDGIDKTNGVFVIITTNRVEKLDPALGVPQVNGDGKIKSSRPGRIDRVFELKELDEKCRYKIAKRILDEYPELWDEVVQKGEGETGAQFQERCAQIALKNYWDDKEMKEKG